MLKKSLALVALAISSLSLNAAAAQIEITRISDTQGIITVVGGDIGSVAPSTQAWLFALVNPFATTPPLNAAADILTSSTMTIAGEAVNFTHTHHYPGTGPIPLIYFGPDNSYPAGVPINSQMAGSIEFTLQSSTLAAVGTTGDVIWGISTYANPVTIGSYTVVSAVPVPAAAWLFGSALIGLAGIKRKK
jgi:hypothetical protein